MFEHACVMLCARVRVLVFVRAFVSASVRACTACEQEGRHTSGCTAFELEGRHTPACNARHLEEQHTSVCTTYQLQGRYTKVNKCGRGNESPPPPPHGTAWRRVETATLRSNASTQATVLKPPQAPSTLLSARALRAHGWHIRPPCTSNCTAQGKH